MAYKKIKPIYKLSVYDYDTNESYDLEGTSLTKFQQQLHTSSTYINLRNLDQDIYIYHRYQCRGPSISYDPHYLIHLSIKYDPKHVPYIEPEVPKQPDMPDDLYSAMFNDYYYRLSGVPYDLQLSLINNNHRPFEPLDLNPWYGNSKYKEDLI